MNGPLTGCFFFDTEEKRVGVIASGLYIKSATTGDDLLLGYHVGLGVPFEEAWEPGLAKESELLRYKVFKDEVALQNYLETFEPEYWERVAE